MTDIMANQARQPPDTLNFLPTEILQLIAIALPSQSALKFIHCCRRVHEACNQPGVWREKIRLNSGFATHPIVSRDSGGMIWKNFVIADAKTSNVTYEDKLLFWLPQAMIYYHEVCSTLKFNELHILSLPTHYSSDMPLFEGRMPTVSPGIMLYYPVDVQSSIVIDVWHKTQAASFCFTAAILKRISLDQSQVSNLWAPAKRFLETSPWTVIQDITPESRPAEYLKLAVILHTLANKAIGFIAIELWAYLTEKRNDLSWEPDGTSNPPLIERISFPMLMNVPSLFEAEALKDFSLCHINKMAAPEFFTGSQWIGYELVIHLSRQRRWPLYTWDGIGGENAEMKYRHYEQPPHTNGNLEDRWVERHATFTLRGWVDPRSYVLQSNYFHAGRETHCLTLKVDSLTGMISVIRHVDFHHVRRRGSFGVMTPFGVLLGGHSPGYWLWLWKLDWSTPDSHWER
ncbi:hypothetical protein GLAREA_12452 [Glarea lozoyensis ATCC 20868]|uniref:F-box domain-containing protein n=1 Tax=Glarea lozoyensis (strain ATCC 20868 / MF5171) TaxID=1116229 RepID=S3DI32_GLAL2|nr:uncharacterized protein GLAREA_12452 [Glarea lozoyensis ATCC 20868]EPE31696.1 hypothetical protein GLAREA_12452 [Glarea lozoyensis ATCC 20868]